eukprot:1195046-Prorocentrum_minimum.AAC.1
MPRYESTELVGELNCRVIRWLNKCPCRPPLSPLESGGSSRVRRAQGGKFAGLEGENSQAPGVISMFAPAPSPARAPRTHPPGTPPPSFARPPANIPEYNRIYPNINKRKP